MWDVIGINKYQVENLISNFEVVNLIIANIFTNIFFKFEIYNFGTPFLGHHYNTLRLNGPCTEVEKIFLKKYINFTLFTPKLPLLWVGGGGGQ